MSDKSQPSVPPRTEPLLSGRRFRNPNPAFQDPTPLKVVKWIFLEIARGRSFPSFGIPNSLNPAPEVDADPADAHLLKETVTPEEINSLRRLIEAGEEIDVYPHLRVGTMVRVNRGPLEGAEGILEKKGEQSIFLVNIKLLGRSVGVKIHAGEIEGI